MEMNTNLSGKSQLLHCFTYQFDGGKHLLDLINQSYFQPHVLLDGQIANKLNNRKSRKSLDRKHFVLIRKQLTRCASCNHSNKCVQPVYICPQLTSYLNWKKKKKQVLMLTDSIKARIHFAVVKFIHSSSASAMHLLLKRDVSPFRYYRFRIQASQLRLLSQNPKKLSIVFLLLSLQ